MERRLQSHYESLSRLIRFTRMADTKAGAALALQFLLLGTLATQFESLFDVVVGSTWHTERFVLTLAIALYCLSLFGAICLGVRVYVPTTPKTGKSLIYFEDIAALDYDTFSKEATQTNEYEIERQLLAQIHQVSRIASLKMRLVRWVFWLSIPSTVLGVGLLAWANIR